MTHNEAASAISLLKERQDLTRDEMCKGFQIALALFDDELIEYFRQSYHYDICALVLDLALHINQPEKIDCFKQYQSEWDEIAYYASKLKIVAIMVKSKQRSLKADILVRELKDKHIIKSNYYEKKFSALLEKSPDELVDSYLGDFKGTTSRIARESYYNNALKSHDIALLQEALEKAKSQNDNNMVARLLRRVALIQAHDDLDKALATVSTIEFLYMQEFALSEIAEHIYAQNPLRAQALVSNLPVCLQYGFRAYLASFNKDKNEIDRIIWEIENLDKTHFLSEDEHDQCLMQVAYNVVDNYPNLVRNILEKLHTLWGETLDIEAEVAVSLGKNDLEEGITYALSIDVEFFQVESLVKIIEFVEDESSLMRLSKLTEHYCEDINYQYDILKAINKKMPLPFEQVWGVTSKMLPYKY